MLVAWISLIIGFALLVKGADYFVDGASSVARKLHIPVFVIGLTVVAFGTSAPELAVSVTAALKGSNDIAIGNVVGSNIFNLLVVLGCSAAICPMAVEKGMVKRDYPLSILAAVVLGALSLDTLFGAKETTIGRVDGIILLLLFAGFMFLTLSIAQKERKNKLSEQEEDAKENIGKPIWTSLLFLALGLAGVIIGADLSVNGAKEIARGFGMSEAMIGLTIVAFGTSLPELVTSIVAARNGESEIAIGNVIGSNIFNILLILGVSGVIEPMSVSNTYIYDIGILIVVSVLAFIPIAKTRRVGRGLGIAMCATYVAYMAYLFIR